MCCQCVELSNHMIPVDNADPMLAHTIIPNHISSVINPHDSAVSVMMVTHVLVWIMVVTIAPIIINHRSGQSA